MHPDSKTLRRTVRRRAELIARLRADGGGVAVLFTAPEVLRNGDNHFDFRPDSSFAHLTAFDEPEAALVIVCGQSTGRASRARSRDRSILFCRVKDPEREIWDGFRHGPEAACGTFGFDEAYPIEQLDSMMPQLLADQPAIHYVLGADAALDARVRGWLDAVRSRARSGVEAPAAAFDLRRHVDEMRLIKDKLEADTMRMAGHISALAHRRAMQVVRPGMMEYQIEAELLHEFHRHGAPCAAYGSIVAGGANACVLHYRANQGTLQDGDLLLIDAGCEYRGYAGDISRTFPVNGRFSAEQREIYEIVLAANAAATAQTRPGRPFPAAHDAAVQVIVRGLVDCGLLHGDVDGLVESGEFRRFYMHRTGHWLGRDVHDCGSYREPAPARGARRAALAPDGTPAWRTLQPGMVVTIEPGVYIRAADDIHPRWHGIGIRIEDDALLTRGGCEILTHEAPRSVSAIEECMREGRALRKAQASGSRKKERGRSRAGGRDRR